MSSTSNLTLMDYMVIVMALVTSALIGIFFSFAKRRVLTAEEYMMAGRNMSYLPVILSIVASNMSAVLMLGSSSEVYVYGTQIMIMSAGVAVGMILAAFVFLPAYFYLKIDTVYEYLEIRFGKATRLIVSFMFIIQIILYSSVTLLAPALALSAVTPLSTELCVIVLGTVCTFYCTIGGLKAVLWTDVFQALLMYTCVVVSLIYSIVEIGGLARVITLAKATGRIEFFNTDFDLRTRYTIWNCFLRGLSYGFGGFGVNQVEIQRLFSVKSLRRAKTALLLSVFPTFCIMVLCYFLGLTLYAVFFGCDPVLQSDVTSIHKYSQLLPYYIVTRMTSVPGIAGLCISGIFSGSLSSLSSAINSVATVTMMDFIYPFQKFGIQTKALICAKFLVLVYGIACTGFSILFSNFGTVQEMATVTSGIMEGPVLAVFLLGIAISRTNEKGILTGFLIGVVFSGWIGFGSTYNGSRPPFLPLSTAACPIQRAFLNISSEIEEDFSCDGNISNCSPYEQDDRHYIFPLYTVSYAWIPVLGFCCTIIVGLATSFIYGRKNARESSVNLFVLSHSGKHKTDEEAEELQLAHDNLVQTIHV